MTTDPFVVLSAFLEKIGSNAEALTVGIDPGTHGAFGFVSSSGAFAVDIPVSFVANQRGRENGVYDLAGIIRLWAGVIGHITPGRISVCLEQSQPLPRDGPFVAFRCGEGFAMWSLYLMSLGVRVETVRPAQWKKSFSLQGGKTNKEAARLKALSLWPTLAADNLKFKKDHNRAEALLLAEYLRRRVCVSEDRSGKEK